MYNHALQGSAKFNLIMPSRQCGKSWAHMLTMPLPMLQNLMESGNENEARKARAAYLARTDNQEELTNAKPDVLI